MTEEMKNCFQERIGGVNFTVKILPAEKAKQNTEDFIKALIFKEIQAFEGDLAS